MLHSVIAMYRDKNRSSESLEASRLIGFSDGVFTVASTLLIQARMYQHAVVTQPATGSGGSRD